MKKLLLLCFGVMVALPAISQCWEDILLIRRDTTLGQGIFVIEPKPGFRAKVIFEAIPPPVVITNKYDDQNPFVTYVGAWSKATNTADPFYLSTCTYSNDPGAYFTVSFTGELQMWSAKASHHGVIGVSLNGGTEVQVNTSSPTRVNDVMIFNALNGGTVKVRVISGYCVVDYFKEIR